MPDMSSSFLSAFLFAFPVLQLWSCFPSLVDWTFQVFGQLEYFNQRDELLFGELAITISPLNEIYLQITTRNLTRLSQFVVLIHSSELMGTLIERF